jgi:hypothetical protein
MLRRMTLTLCRSSMLAQFSSRRLQRYLSIAKSLRCLLGTKTFKQAFANNFKIYRGLAIASSSHHGRDNINHHHRSWHKAIGLVIASKTSGTLEARSTKQAVCSPRPSPNIPSADSCPSQPSIAIPHPVRMDISNSQATTRSF